MAGDKSKHSLHLLDLKSICTAIIIGYFSCMTIVKEKSEFSDIFDHTWQAFEFERAV